MKSLPHVTKEYGGQQRLPSNVSLLNFVNFFDTARVTESVQ